MTKHYIEKKYFHGCFAKKQYGYRKWFRQAYVCKPIAVCRPEPVYYVCAPKYNACYFPTYY